MTLHHPSSGQRTWAPPLKLCWWDASPWLPESCKHMWCCKGRRDKNAKSESHLLLHPCPIRYLPFINVPWYHPPSIYKMEMLLHTSQKRNHAETWKNGTLPGDVETPSQHGLSKVFAPTLKISEI